MAEITEATIGKINQAVGEALILVPGEATIILATVVSGYTELVSLNPSNSSYLDRLCATLFTLAEFLMEHGRHNLARQLIVLRDEVLKSCASD
jgi:hypothetical protein